MPPAQEILGEVFRDEAELQEQADRALTQELGEASAVVDGEEVENPASAPCFEARAAEALRAGDAADVREGA
ncbi:MAG: hypothetical protein NTU62_13315 [Spirochaetes bacterium]|nr:hypothetical protein [Spirochaetota bacterium]